MRGLFLVLFLLLQTRMVVALPVLEDAQDQIAVIEKQVEISCGGESERRIDPARYKVAESILSGDGPASQLSKALKQQAVHLSTALSNSNEIVLRRNSKKLETNMDQAQADIDQALSRLKEGVARNESEDVVEDLRDRVKQAYQRFKVVREPASARQLFPEELKQMRESTLAQLDRVAGLSERLDKTVRKAQRCYCRIGYRNCKSEEELREDIGYYNAYNTQKSAEREAQGSPGERGSSGMSAR
jgi:hypothetical protein